MKQQYDEEEEYKHKLQAKMFGVCNKNTKRIFETFSKLNKDDHFYLCLKQDMMIFISLGTTQSHYFEINKDIQIDHPRPGQIKVIRLDLQHFQLIASTFPQGSTYEFIAAESEFLIKNEYKQVKTDQDVTLLVELSTYNFSQAETQTLEQILNVEQNEILSTIRMESPNQLKIVLQQLKALKTEVIRIDVQPRLNQYMSWHYDPQARNQMKYLFSNFNIDTNSEDELKFHYNAKEIIQAINLLNKENQVALLFKSNGMLILKQYCEDSVTFSVLRNTVQNQII